ncbi:MAG: ytcD [Firmicutes bacterium]|nr:ytcD [Bacillota bacterium]
MLTHDLIEGKWKKRILWHIINGNNRFSLLQKVMPDITHKMLITQLKELVTSGILIRNEYEKTPPRVEYHISPQYQSIIPIMQALWEFTKQYAADHEINLPD